MSSLRASPVLVTSAEVEGVMVLPIADVVVAADAEDPEVPRNLGTYLMGWSAGGQDSITLRARWVELLTDRAWEASATISPRDLELNGNDTAELTLIFGPHGQMVVASDPLPQDGPRRDVAQVCGQRIPAADRDVSAEANSIARLASTLAFDYPPLPAETICPEPGN